MPILYGNPLIYFLTLLLLNICQKAVRLIGVWGQELIATVSDTWCFQVFRDIPFGFTKEVLRSLMGSRSITFNGWEIWIVRMIISSRTWLFSVLRNNLLHHSFLISYICASLQLFILKPIEKVNINILFLTDFVALSLRGHNRILSYIGCTLLSGVLLISHFTLNLFLDHLSLLRIQSHLTLFVDLF